MKKRYVPIITFTIAMLLVGSIAYAADRRKKSRQIHDESHDLSEAALTAELMPATEVQHKKRVDTLTTGSDQHLDELSDNSAETVASTAVTD